MNEFNVNQSNPIYETMYQNLRSILIDSSTLTSPGLNKTYKHTIPHVILRRHSTKHTAQVSDTP
jgi:hypothetical protein